MMVQSNFSARNTSTGGRDTSAELKEAVTWANDSLNKLNGEFQVKKEAQIKTAFEHVQIQHSTAHRVKKTSQESIESCERNIELCLDLFDRLERAEELALKIKKLRETVDRIAQKLP